MTCCCTGCYDSQFDAKQAAHDLKRFRKSGPDPTTRALIDALVARRVTGASLLDIGGGVGAVHHQLLDAGAARATHVDASASYIGAAREEASRRGHDDRVEFVHGDFVGVAPAIGAADVVTLDRVICCYPDMEALVEASASRATRLYGVVFPRDRWFLKIAFPAINLFKRVMRSAFRVYVHPVAAIDDAIRRQGFEPRTVLDTLAWRVAVYSR